jgi:mRNA interferase RelE/StbE
MPGARFEVLILRTATKQLNHLHKPIRENIYHRMMALAENPRPQMAIPLRGITGVWRLRVGDYRVIYEIFDDERRVIVSQVRHRREAYDGL